MPRAKQTAALAGLVASDSEPDLDDFDASEVQAARSQRNSMSVAKKSRGRPPSATKVTKPATRTTGRTRGRPAAAAAQSTPKLASIERHITTAPPNNTRRSRRPTQDDNAKPEDVELAASAVCTLTKPVRGRPKGIGSAVNTATISSTLESAPASAARPRGRPARHVATAPPLEIPETQYEAIEPDVMDIDDATHDSVDEDTMPHPTDPAKDLIGYGVSDASLRRRLGDLGKKYESLEMRHRDLREVGVKEAERNFDRLRKQSEERTAAANKLIAELKQELAAQTALASEGDELRKELETSEARTEGLQSDIKTLTSSLAEARKEIKTLSMKLAALRSGEGNARVPGSALKATSVANRTVQAEAAHAAKAKEELYGDLTGLIILDLKQDETEDIVDCIQTGRNGSLHFKLVVETPELTDSYEDLQVTYRPQLDANRDGDLMEILPEYLTEEISFPRPQASLFYNRVMRSLTDKLD